MIRYAAELSYLGTAYHGWQIQENANSVQQEIERALRILLSEETSVTGCGRTDTGVHASHYVMHFDSKKELAEPNKFVFQLNSLLPKDIAVSIIRKVSLEFHARFSCYQRVYEYYITTKKNPFLLDTAYFFPHQLDINAMNQAAQLLLGRKDFKAFSKGRTQVFTYFCEVSEACWTQKENEDVLVFQIKADRFLRNMVRAIVGTLLEVGLGKMTFSQLEQVIISQNRSLAGASVKAHGLFLKEVNYKWEEFLIHE